MLKKVPLLVSMLWGLLCLSQNHQGFKSWEGDFAYDKAGNLLEFPCKGSFAIGYNHLPFQFVAGGDSMETMYSSSGELIEKRTSKKSWSYALN